MSGSPFSNEEISSFTCFKNSALVIISFKNLLVSSLLTFLAYKMLLAPKTAARVICFSSLQIAENLESKIR